MGTNAACATVDNRRDLTELLAGAEPIFALFYASWCPFCAKFLPIFEKHAADRASRFILVKDDRETMMDAYAVKVFPTVLFFEQGTVSRRLDGIPGVGLDEERLTAFLRSCP